MAQNKRTETMDSAAERARRWNVAYQAAEAERSHWLESLPIYSI